MVAHAVQDEPFALAEPGAKWQDTDVVLEKNLPWRRLHSGAASGDYMHLEPTGDRMEGRMTIRHGARAGQINFGLSIVALVSSCALYLYVEAAPESPTPFFVLMEQVFPASGTAISASVHATPAFGFSEANLLLAWAFLTAIDVCFVLAMSLASKATAENAQVRATTVICSLLAGICLLVLTPLLVSAYRVAHG